MPVVKFGLGQKLYSKFDEIHHVEKKKHILIFAFRYYTKWFDKTNLTGATLGLYTLKNRPQWEEDIAQWQQPILDDM